MPTFNPAENTPEEEDELLVGIKQAGLYFEQDLCDLHISEDILATISKDLASQYHMIPVGIDEMDILTLVSDSADALRNVSSIQHRIRNYSIKILISSEENVKAALRQYYDITAYRQITRVSNSGASAESKDDSHLKRRVKQLLDWCIDQKASDMHLIPYSNGIFVRVRLNGFLKDVSEDWHFLPEDGPLVVNILKNMDTSGNASQQLSRMPNSGHFVIMQGDMPVECRLQTNPLGDSSDDRQHADIRFLPQLRSIRTLDKLYTGKDLHAIKQTLYRGGAGMYLLSGPVGTGKSTSILAMQEYIRKLYSDAGRELNIFDIENPIEYVDERNIQVEERIAPNNPELSLDSMTALRSALRSDPDIIIYGEIRDSADARVATRACQTGLRMFSTVHAGDCIRTINRLLDLDVSRMSLLAELKLIVCQRLIGRLCPYCSQPHVLTEDEESVLTEKEKKRARMHTLTKVEQEAFEKGELPREELQKIIHERGILMERGSLDAQRHCPHCQDGLVGRSAIPEYIIFDDRIRNELLNMRSFDAVPSLLRSHGFQSMWDKGLMMALHGDAELSEVIQKIGRD